MKKYFQKQFSRFLRLERKYKNIMSTDNLEKESENLEIKESSEKLGFTSESDNDSAKSDVSIKDSELNSETNFIDEFNITDSEISKEHEKSEESNVESSHFEESTYLQDAAQEVEEAYDESSDGSMEEDSSDSVTFVDINELGDDEETEEEETKKPRGYNPDNPRFIDSVFDFVELFIFSLAAVLILTTFVFRHSIVEGSSMEQTLFENEHIIISDLFYTPKRGDIIVCEDYTTILRKPIVKRVIAVEGDRVEVSEDGIVKVNGVLLEEDYVYVDPGTVYFKDAVDLIVPEDEVFVMGDHRNMSTDSRDIGPIRVDSILGKVLVRFYPFEKFGPVE